MSEENIYGNTARAEYEDKNGNIWSLQAEATGDVEIITGEDIPSPADPRQPRYNAVIRSGEKVIRAFCYTEPLSESDVEGLRSQMEESRSQAGENSTARKEETSPTQIAPVEIDAEHISQIDKKGIQVTWNLDQLSIDGPTRTSFQIDPDIGLGEVDSYRFSLSRGDIIASVQVTTSFGSVSGSLSSQDFSASASNSGTDFPLSGFSVTSDIWSVSITGNDSAAYIITGDFEVF